MLKAGFAEMDITPPLGTLKIGWLKRIVGEEILAPLYARVAVFKNEAETIAFVQLDTLCVAWEEVEAIRLGVEHTYSFPGAHIMIAATHNHAGPAVAEAGEVPKDDAYAADLVAKVIAAFGTALANLQAVEVGFNHVYEWHVAYNRRVVMRDDTVHTHGNFNDPEALFIEGPIDPEVAVLAVRDTDHRLLGVLVNFACHTTHHGGDGLIHPGYPGVMAAHLRSRGCPVTLFLNGAAGNTHTSNPAEGGKGKTEDESGTQLAEDVLRALEGMSYQTSLRLSAGSRTLDLPYRQVTEDEVHGRIRGAQRFIDSAIYDRTIPPLLEKVRREGTHPAEIQVLGLVDIFFAGVPGEYFVEFGLRIKVETAPAYALVVSCANGVLGYIPTVQAFTRGGYETTFAPSSKLAPEAGDTIADTAVQIIQSLRG
ncbi:MAG: hypothetical protein E4H27_05015 [Anaerolineales bacterium]|nr:MAG: hypothetical protein E4H27_05015 [Anaerolineales bacterium]